MPPQKIIKQGSLKKVSVANPANDSKTLPLSTTFSKQQKDVYDRLVSSQTQREPEDDKLTSYLDHLGGKCLCTLCNCGKHKCEGRYCGHKPTLHNGQTIYQREFQQKTPETSQRLSHNFFDQIKQQGDIGGVSTYKHDFPGYTSKVSLSKNAQRPTTRGVPFSGLSTYQNMYLNWGMGDSAQIYPQNNPTIIKDLPFNGKSVYKDSYQGTQVAPPKSTKGLNAMKSPLSPPDMKFQAESVSKTSYQPFNVKKQTSDKPTTNPEMNPSFQGQYNTQYIKEYDNKTLTACPAKEVLDSITQR